MTLAEFALEAQVNAGSTAVRDQQSQRKRRTIAPTRQHKKLARQAPQRAQGVARKAQLGGPSGRASPLDSSTR